MENFVTKKVSYLVLIIAISIVFIGLYQLNTSPSLEQIKNSENSIHISGYQVKLLSGASFNTQPFSSDQLQVVGSIFSSDNVKLNGEFSYRDILNVWTIINGNLYQAFTIDPATERSGALFRAYFQGDLLYTDIFEILLENQYQTEDIQIVIQLNGANHLLKTTTEILISS